MSKAFKESKPLRDFIKEEALKQVTGDYDVVYQAVKSKSVLGLERRGASAETIRDILLPFFENEAALIEIENALPYLTIFVPDLLEGSFSAENWNTISQIPNVGIRSYESDDVKIITSTGNVHVLEAKYWPDFPVVVIKDNERLVSNADIVKYNSLDTNILTDPSNPIQLRVASTNYQISTPTTVLAGPRVNQVLSDAYNVYGNYTPGGWQRDYIYYGLTPNNTTGQLNPSYREHVTSFKLAGNPAAAYSWIASSQDPTLRPFVWNSQTTNQISGWTDGEYEFKMWSSYGAKNSNLGSDEPKQFGASPTEVFEITFSPNPNFMANLYSKIPTIVSTKNIDFYNGAFYNLRLEFSIWYLNSYSNQWKLSFEEADSSIENTNTITATNKFNTNFSIEPEGIIKKIGLKFGASYEQNFSNVYTYKYTDVSDPLGSSVINFYDNAVNLNISTNTLYPRTYSTGRVEFEFRPLLVQ